MSQNFGGKVVYQGATQIEGTGKRYLPVKMRRENRIRSTCKGQEIIRSNLFQLPQYRNSPCKLMRFS